MSATNNQILLALKRRLEEVSASGTTDIEAQRNSLKEQLQYYVLNFVYYHPEYAKWTMYGGSALRICHRLNRMSVDLDFEVVHPVTAEFLDTLQAEIAEHFQKVYGTDETFLTVKRQATRGLLLKFHVGNALDLGHDSDQIHVKIDLNHFTPQEVVIERIPINHEQLSFVIRTYNMSTLMASKLAAIFRRGERGVGKEVYEEKGRDIYDLLWYMNKKIAPDLDYLRAKDVDIKDIRALFDRLTLQMNKVNETNLRQDLLPLFTERGFIENWLANWRESYLRLLDDYRIRTIKALKSIAVTEDFDTDVYTFAFTYQTDEDSSYRILYRISDLWIDFADGNLGIPVENNIESLLKIDERSIKPGIERDKNLRMYATLFFYKSRDYLDKTAQIVIGDSISTKLIRKTADKLNSREQILLNKSALKAVELEDLLK